MTIGADPAALERLAAAGPGQAFTLTVAARALERAGGWHRHRSPASHVHTAPAVAELRRVAQRVLALDAWVGDVATALRAADRAPLHLGLLSLGTDHPTAHAAASTATPPLPAVVRLLSDPDLDALAAVPSLPTPWRDRIHRERVRRWLAGLEQRLTAVPEDREGWLAGLVDTWLVDRVSAVVDLHRTREEEVDRHRAAAAGARRLLARPDLRVLSFTAGHPPTMRVALGDPDRATHLAVLVPGTGTGLHALTTSLEDVTALHGHATLAAADGTTVATVLDLHAAPADLGRAVDPAPSRLAGAATAAFLDDLASPARTTVVGHSYGAIVAARASDGHPIDDLVLLGAPGVGVDHRDQLPGATRVWAARARGDPIRFVADADELLRALPARWRPDTGPLAEPLVAHGPDPVDPEFGARRLPTAATGPGIATVAAHGHLDYLTPGTTSLANVAAVVVAGRLPGPRTGRRPPQPVSGGRPPMRDRRASAAGG